MLSFIQTGAQAGDTLLTGDNALVILAGAIVSMVSVGVFAFRWMLTNYTKMVDAQTKRADEYQDMVQDLILKQGITQGEKLAYKDQFETMGKEVLRVSVNSETMFKELQEIPKLRNELTAVKKELDSQRTKNREETRIHAEQLTAARQQNQQLEADLRATKTERDSLLKKIVQLETELQSVQKRLKRLETDKLTPEP